MNDLSDSLTVKEVAARLPGVTAAAVTGWITTGLASRKRRGERFRLKATKLGRWRVRPADLEAFLKARTADSLPADTDIGANIETAAEFDRRCERDLEELRAMGVRC